MNKSRESINKKVISKLHPGAIILLHDSCRDADVLLKQLILSILEKGYKILPLDEMLNIEVYES
jgi:peptidoglycan/xylan/chitin deacetylase (PgdA/CDA1 family)